MTKIIADISGNHGGDLGKAKDLVRAAADCGCDYAKFQYYFPMEMPDYKGNEADYDKLAVPSEWLRPLFDTAEAVNIPLFASIFQERAIARLECFHPPFFKLASPESTRLDDYERLIKRMRRESGLIISTGIKDLEQMDGLADKYGAILLYCPPQHPCPPLSHWMIADGLSDHCADLTNARRAVEMGTEWIERHIKLDNNCIDAAFSSNPKEMAELCKIAHE